MLPYILGFSFLSLVAAVLFDYCKGKDNKVVPVAITSFILALIVNWLCVWLLNLPFSHPLTGGYVILFLTNLAIPTIVSGMIGSDGYGDKGYNGVVAGIISIFATLIVLMIASAVSTPKWCDTAAIRQQIALLDLQPAPEGTTFHSTSLDQLIRVPASAALTKAGNELSSGENVAIGNYLKTNRAYIQVINSVPYYVIDLAVTNAIGFREAGSVIPGFLLVNAVDNNARAEFRRGYQLHYVPSGKFNLDLDRKVYFNFLLGNNVLIKDLDGMEVDDNFNPTYTGTIISHVMSYKGVKPTGVYYFDPATGKGEEIALDDISTKLPWLDRIYPLDWVLDQVRLWGKFANHDACNILNNNGQVQVDSHNDVTTPNGIEYQITMTGMGPDPSMTGLITVNPTTRTGFIYPLKGKSIGSIKKQFNLLSTKIRVNGLEVDECELHAIDGVNTVYCIFTSVDDAGDTSVSGYGFVALENADSDSDYALGQSFDEAYNQYLQIRSSSGNDTVVANTADDVTIIGTVVSNEWVSDADNGSRLINVLSDDGTEYWLMARGDSKNAAAAVPGKQVTVTAFAREGQEFMTVRYLTVEGAPDFGGSLYWQGAVRWLQSLFK